jgi:hypothetical protein
MVSTVQEISGVHKALDRLEQRIKSYRSALNDTILNKDGRPDFDATAITEGEVETIEALIDRLARRLSGMPPNRREWEPMHDYCSRNEGKEEGWAAQNYEYFRWALMWVAKSRTYVEYLSGLQVAEGEPRGGESQPVSTGPLQSVPRYDVALSFAGEDRDHARKVAELLRGKEISVFYDEYEKAALWGRNLYTHLSDVYQNRARYCLIFISSNYAQKLWTRKELEAAQARAFGESREYILPLILDDTKLPGMEVTTGYIDLRKASYEEVVSALIEKLSGK